MWGMLPACRRRLGRGQDSADPQAGSAGSLAERQAQIAGLAGVRQHNAIYFGSFVSGVGASRPVLLHYFQCKTGRLAPNAIYFGYLLWIIGSWHENCAREGVSVPATKLTWMHLMLAPSQIPKRRSRAADRIAAKAAMNPKGRKSPVALPQKQEQPKMTDPTEHFACATELLRSLLKNSEVTDRFDPHQRPNTRMVYTKGVTLWMLMLQRLGNGLSLEATVEHVLAHDRDLLPENKRVRDGTLSKNSSGFQKARTKLPLASIHEFSSAVCDYLGSIGEPTFGAKRDRKSVV